MSILCLRINKRGGVLSAGRYPSDVPSIYLSFGVPNIFYSITIIRMSIIMNAKVTKIYPLTERKAKD